MPFPAWDAQALRPIDQRHQVHGDVAACDACRGGGVSAMRRRCTSNAKHSSATSLGRERDRPVCFSIRRNRWRTVFGWQISTSAAPRTDASLSCHTRNVSKSISRSSSGRSPKPSTAAPTVLIITSGALTAAVARMEPSNTATDDVESVGARNITLATCRARRVSRRSSKAALTPTRTVVIRDMRATTQNGQMHTRVRNSVAARIAATALVPKRGSGAWCNEGRRHGNPRHRRIERMVRYRSSDISHNRAQLLMPALATTISNRPRRQNGTYARSVSSGHRAGVDHRRGHSPAWVAGRRPRIALATKRPDALLAGAVAAVTRVRLAAH